MMIEFFIADEFNKIRKQYENKIVVIIPYAERKISELKKKMKILKLKKHVNYNYFKNSKYSQYEYFILISLTDVNNEILKVKKILEEYYGNGEI